MCNTFTGSAIRCFPGKRPRSLTSAKDTRRYHSCMPSGSRMNNIEYLQSAQRPILSWRLQIKKKKKASDVKIILTCQREALDLQRPPTHYEEGDPVPWPAASHAHHAEGPRRRGGSRCVRPIFPFEVSEWSESAISTSSCPWQWRPTHRIPSKCPYVHA